LQDNINRWTRLLLVNLQNTQIKPVEIAFLRLLQKTRDFILLSSHSISSQKGQSRSINQKEKKSQTDIRIALGLVA